MATKLKSLPVQEQDKKNPEDETVNEILNLLQKHGESTQNKIIAALLIHFAKSRKEDYEESSKELNLQAKNMDDFYNIIKSVAAQ